MARILAIGLLAIVLFGASNASAAVLTRSFRFSATDFATISGPAPAVSTVSGRFKVVVDTEKSGQTMLAGASGSLSVPVPTSWAYRYTDFEDGYLLISGDAGEDLNGPLVAQVGKPDFILSFRGVGPGAPHHGSLVYTTMDGGYLSRNVTFSAVPEATTWAMMIFGFAAIGSMARRRGVLCRQ